MLIDWNSKKKAWIIHGDQQLKKSRNLKEWTNNWANSWANMLIDIWIKVETISARRTNVWNTVGINVCIGVKQDIEPKKELISTMSSLSNGGSDFMSKIVIPPYSWIIKEMM